MEYVLATALYSVSYWIITFLVTALFAGLRVTVENGVYLYAISEFTSGFFGSIIGLTGVTGRRGKLPAPILFALASMYFTSYIMDGNKSCWECTLYLDTWRAILTASTLTGIALATILAIIVGATESSA